MKKRFSKRFISIISILMVFLISVNTLALTDVSNHWARDYIERGVQRGFITGFPDGSFLPDNNVTRAEFMQMINRAFGFTNSGNVNFVDVSPNDWFFNAVAIANTKGYIRGYEDNTIRPNNPISREEVAVIIYRIVSIADNSTASDRFNDSAQITWSRDAINATVAAGILNGYPEGDFRPAQNMTRGEAARVIDSSLNIGGQGNNINTLPPITPTPTPILPPTISPTPTPEPTPTPTPTSSVELIVDTNRYGSISRTERIYGDVEVIARSTTLLNLDINGDLILTEATTGTINLENVTVRGTMYVYGRGSNINIENGSIRDLLIVSDAERVTMKIDSETTISNADIQARFTSITGEGTISRANVAASNVTLSRKPNTLTGSFTPSYTNESRDVLIRVHEKNSTSTRVQDATVTINSSSTSSRSGTTNSNGEVTFSNVAPGNYTITVKRSGFTDYSSTITVINNTNNEFQIPLTPEAVYSVTFIVRDAASTSTRIQGARVSISGFSPLLTQANGEVIFNSVPNGNYTYTVSKAGFQDTNGSISVSNNNTSITIDLTSTSTSPSALGF